VCHMAAESEADALYMVRKLLSFMPQNNMEDPPFVDSGDDPLRMEESLDNLIPDDPSKPYDIKDVIRLVVDNHEFYEIHEAYAPNIVVGFSAWGAYDRRGGEPARSAGRVCWTLTHPKSSSLCALLRCFQYPPADLC
jgi:hypothetical protein